MPLLSTNIDKNLDLQYTISEVKIKINKLNFKDMNTHGP